SGKNPMPAKIMDGTGRIFGFDKNRTARFIISINLNSSPKTEPLMYMFGSPTGVRYQAIKPRSNYIGPRPTDRRSGRNLFKPIKMEKALILGDSSPLKPFPHWLRGKKPLSEF